MLEHLTFFTIRNVMLSDDGEVPILMDFGSTIKARLKVETRSQALSQQVREYIASIRAIFKTVACRL